MREIDNRSVEGELSVSRSARVGSDLTVGGRATVRHGLRVDGWIDAPRLKGAMKGLYESEESLRRSYPRPRDGWHALVGDSLPTAIWRAEGGEWKPTGGEGGAEISLDRLERLVAEIDGRQNSLEMEVAALRDEMEKRDEGSEDVEPEAPSATIAALERRLKTVEMEASQTSTALRELKSSVATAGMVTSLNAEIEKQRRTHQEDMEQADARIDGLHDSLATELEELRGEIEKLLSRLEKLEQDQEPLPFDGFTDEELGRIEASVGTGASRGAEHPLLYCAATGRFVLVESAESLNREEWVYSWTWSDSWRYGATVRDESGVHTDTTIEGTRPASTRRYVDESSGEVYRADSDGRLIKVE